MLVTRATRHDTHDLEAFLRAHDFGEGDPARGTAFIARDGSVIGCVRLIEVAPGTLVVDDVVVHADRRGEGIGGRLLQTALNSRGGTLYLCCHAELIPFYARFGFAETTIEECPAEVVDFWRSTGDYPTEPGHVHHYLKAR